MGARALEAVIFFALYYQMTPRYILIYDLLSVFGKPVYFQHLLKGCSAGLSVICPQHTQLPWLRREPTSLHMFLKSFSL